jgi:GNAT superfamily N-acetyltransferase
VTVAFALLARGFSLRPEEDRDIGFLLALFSAGREPELAGAPWTPEQKAAFLQSQFDAQRFHYRKFFAQSLFAVLELEGAPVGRLYLDQRPGMLDIIDIALIPQYCGQGLGTILLQAIMDAARAADSGVNIFVEKFNPALRLYRRLGFNEICDHQVYLEMRWTGVS